VSTAMLCVAASATQADTLGRDLPLRPVERVFMAQRYPKAGGAPITQQAGVLRTWDAPNGHTGRLGEIVGHPRKVRAVERHGGSVDLIEDGDHLGTAPAANQPCSGHDA